METSNRLSRPNRLNTFWDDWDDRDYPDDHMETRLYSTYNYRVKASCIHWILPTSVILVGKPSYNTIITFHWLVAFESSYTDPKMSRSSFSPLNIINTWNKLTRYQHHHRFLSRCRRINSIPSGLKLKFNLALGSSDEELQKRCQLQLQAASNNILNEFINFTQTTTAGL